MAETADCFLNMENGGDVIHKYVIIVFDHHYWSVYGMSGLPELAPGSTGCVEFTRRSCGRGGRTEFLGSIILLLRSQANLILSCLAPLSAKPDEFDPLCERWVELLVNSGCQG